MKTKAFIVGTLFLVALNFRLFPGWRQYVW